MVGRLLSYWEVNFSGAMLNFGVYVLTWDMYGYVSIDNCHPKVLHISSTLSQTVQSSASDLIFFLTPPGWWFQIVCIFTAYLGKFPILTCIFLKGAATTRTIDAWNTFFVGIRWNTFSPVLSIISMLAKKHGP